MGDLEAGAMTDKPEDVLSDALNKYPPYELADDARAALSQLIEERDALQDELENAYNQGATDGYNKARSDVLRMVEGWKV